ncbi:MAG: hypothetical protein ACRDT0_13965 [Pseudonocardiaceae bacterium]
MRLYRILWSTVTVALGVVGAAVAFVALPTGALLALLVIAMILGAAGRAALTGRDGTGEVPVWRLVAAGGVAAALGVVIAGLVALLGAAALLLVALLAAVSPQAMRWYVQHRPRPAAGAGRQPAHGMRSEGVHSEAGRDVRVAESAGSAAGLAPAGSLTDEELCLAWRASFTAMGRESDPCARARIAGIRQTYLDELERRDPVGFARWMATGPRAGSDPGKYVIPTARRSRLHRPPAGGGRDTARGHLPDTD